MSEPVPNVTPLLSAPASPSDEWEKFAVFAEACRILDAAQIPHVMGGGVAIRAYGRPRPLKDGDIFVERAWVFPALDELTRQGNFHTRDTDATWLFKATKWVPGLPMGEVPDEVVVDLIVRTTGDLLVTAETTRNARLVELYGHHYHMMSPEDVLFRKIYSHREGRPDLLDALSMLANPDLELNWAYFMSLVGKDPGPVLDFLQWACGPEAHAMATPAWTPHRPSVPRRVLQALGRKRIA